MMRPIAFYHRTKIKLLQTSLWEYFCKPQILTLNPHIYSLYLLYWSLTSCKVSEKTNEKSLRTLNMGGPHRQGLLIWIHSGKPRVQNYSSFSISPTPIHFLISITNKHNHEILNIWVTPLKNGGQTYD